MLERKIKLLIFAFFLQFIIFNIYSFYPSISQSISCSNCVVGNCECQAPQGLDFQPTTFGIYESQDCSGDPLFYWKVENGKAIWKPEKVGNYYIRFFTDYKSSQCFSISVEEQDNTPPTTTVSIQDLGNGNYKATFSCTDDKSGCDKTFYCFGTSNTCTPSQTVTQALSLSCASCCYIRYYSIDKAGNKENIKSASMGAACTCKRADPTLSTNPTSQRGRAGEEKSYSISITNNDNHKCEASTFRISVVCQDNFECKLEREEIKVNPQTTATISLSIKPSSSVKPGKYKFKVSINQDDPQRTSFIEVEYEVIGEEAWILDFIVKKGTQEIKVDRNMEVTVGKDEQVKLIVRTNKDVGKETKRTGVKHFIFIERKKDNDWERVGDACTEGTSCEYTPERTPITQTYRARIVVLQNTIMPILTSPEATLIFSDWSISLSIDPKKSELEENEKIKLIATLNRELIKDVYVKLLEKEEGKEWNVLTTFGSNEEDLGKKEFSYEVQHQKGKYYYKAQITTTINGREIVLAESNEINLRWISNEVSVYLEPERDTYYLYQPITIHVKGYAVNQIFVEVKNEGYNFWVINPSKTFGPEERIDWLPTTISSEQEIGRACIFASYQILLTKEWKDAEKKCFSVKGKAKWIVKLEVDKTSPSPGEEVTFVVRLCEDEACNLPFPLFSPYFVYLIDSNTQQAITPIESCIGKSTCTFKVREDTEKSRTFYVIVSDMNKQDIRGKSSEITVTWRKKVEEKLPNLVVTDIRVIDGIVFYKVKNSGNEKIPPTCSAIFVGSAEVDATDYVDSLEVGEERWEAFEENNNKEEIKRIVENSGSSTVEITVKVNNGACAQWGIKERVREANYDDNSKKIVVERQKFCEDYQTMGREGCYCNDERCNKWCQLEGKTGRCEKECKCSGVTTSDIFARGLWYAPSYAGSTELWYCYGNNGYNETSMGCFNLEIYESDKRVFPSTPANYICGASHGTYCERIHPFQVNKDAVYRLSLQTGGEDTNKDNNEWKGKITTNFWDFVKENIRSCLPPFVYGKVGESKKILPAKGNFTIMEPAIKDAFYAEIISPQETEKQPSISVSPNNRPREIYLRCVRPVSGRFRICDSSKRDVCTPEIEYACLSSPPVTMAEVFQPVSCSFSLGKESFCFFNGKCEKGLWIILNKEGNPLTYPIVKSLSPSLTIPSSALKSKGKVKAIAICFQPEVKIFSSTFEVA